MALLVKANFSIVSSKYVWKTSGSRVDGKWFHLFFSLANKDISIHKAWNAWLEDFSMTL